MCIRDSDIREQGPEGRELLKIPRGDMRQFDWEKYAISISCPKSWKPETLEEMI